MGHLKDFKDSALFSFLYNLFVSADYCPQVFFPGGVCFDGTNFAGNYWCFLIFGTFGLLLEYLGGLKLPPSKKKHSV